MIKSIKKIVGFLCSAAFCTVIAVGMPQMAKAAEVTIDETNFPDVIFRDYVKTFDKNKNGGISEEEITEVKTISVHNKSISSLKGVEYFTALTSLECYKNQLTSLDISKNTALKELNCSENQLTSLDVSKNTALMMLVCSNNQLTSLDVSKNISLTHFWCYSNQLTSLDVSKNTNLVLLHCSSNQLTSLDVSKNTALIELGCDNNQLTSLDVSKNTALTALACHHNQLTSLDVSKNTALRFLPCYNNQLTSLDVSKNTALKILYCNHNQLTNLDVSKNVALETLHCYCNQLTSLNVSNITALIELSCYGNQLTSLDVSDNAALAYLQCYSNSLTTLDVGSNTALMLLKCSGNRLASLDLKKNTALTNLDCCFNQLTNLDLSNNKALETLYCYFNQLANLDLSNNKFLETLYCYSNNITELKLHSQMYDKLLLYKKCLHGPSTSLSDLQNVTETKINDSWLVSLIKVTDITKPATYKVNGENFTIIYVDTIATPNVTPTYNFIPANCGKLFYDYNYTNPVSGSAVVIYGNGANLTVDGKKVNNKIFTAYIDILASYKYTVNDKGVVKPSVGKVIVGITKSNVKPEVNNKNKITDTSASKIARATIKNGQVKVTALGKESGLVYLWIIDTGNKGVYECCPINVQLAPKKLEVQDISGNKLKNTKLENGKTLDVCVAGLVGSTKTNDCTYTATVDPKYQSYINVTPVAGSTDRFTITATGLNNNKNTKAAVTFKCDQNGKKINFSLTVTK